MNSSDTSAANASPPVPEPPVHDSGDILLARTFRLARKELREILRDRRTIITLVLMPLLVYPLLGVIMRRGLLSGLETPGEVEVHLCVQTEADADIVSRILQRGERLLQASGAPPAPPVNDGSPAAAVSELLGAESQKTVFQYRLSDAPTEESLRYLVSEGYSDLGIQLRPQTDREPFLFDRGGNPVQFHNWELFKRSQSPISERAYEEVTSRLEAVNKRYIDRLLREIGISASKPAEFTTVEVTSQGTGGYSLITFIPLVLVLMTMTGAVYPAIDLTAGERERGTMEILVAAPVSRMTLLGGKFLAVLVVALLTASVNMISMFATLFSLGLEDAVLGDAGWKVIPLIVVMMIVFAAFFSAVLLSLTSVARSFKEAQAYLIPLMLISLTPGVFSLMPNLKMNTLLAVTPLANTVLLGRDLLQGYFNPLMFGMVLISTTVYGLLALSLAARIFGSDAVLYGSGGSWSDMFRRPKVPLQVAPLAVAWTTLAIVCPLFLFVSSLSGRIDGTMTSRLLVNGAVSVAIFVLVPLVLAKLANVSTVTGFAFTKPAAAMMIVAVLLGTSLWVFVYEMNLFIISDARVEVLKELTERMKLDLNAVPLAVKLLGLAIAPALCEEFFFRGFLQNSLRTRLSAAGAIAGSAILFGLFHVVMQDALFFERFFPTMFMGVVLGIVFEQSRSVVPGMLLHVTHNGLLMTISHYENRLKEMGIGTEDRQHLPLTWLVVAAVPIVVAAGIMWRRRASVRSA
ncbi:MAG: ABC transporter permease subunit/CPBP intramembrane protease [Planctomycetaceae bacterium]